MFSYILVVSRDYILLIYICPMLKAGKVHTIACCAILAILFKNYFNMVSFCSIVQKFDWLLSWKSRKSTLLVNFKIEYVLRAKRKIIESSSYQMWFFISFAQKGPVW